MSYTKKTWASGDTVTSSALNNMETGIDNAANPFIVTFTKSGNIISADKTFSEITTAFNNGLRVTGIYGNNVYSIDNISSSTIYFLSISSFWESITVSSSNYISSSIKSPYLKPNSGIPETDLAQAVKDKLNPFVVTLTPTAQDFSGTMDKTVAEIKSAYDAGKRIIFRVMESASTYSDVAVTMTYQGSNLYPSFNAFIIMDELNLLIFAATGNTDDGTTATYGTTIFPLTPMS